MPSDPTPVSLLLRGTVVVPAALIITLICPLSVAASAPVVAKKKPFVAAKPVFSVSSPETAGPKSTADSHPTIRASRSPDTAGRADGAAAPVQARDSILRETPAPKAAIRGMQPEPKRQADTSAKAVPVTVMKTPVATTVPVKKHSPRKRSLLFRIAIFLGSIVIIIGSIRFVRKQRESPRFLTTTRLSVMDKEIQRACRYIEKNFSDPGLSLEKICKDLVTGEAFIEVLMERDLGVTVNDFIAHVRINHAKRMLSKDPSAASEVVAQESGFETSAAFLACFKKLTGAAFDAYARKKATSGR